MERALVATMELVVKPAKETETLMELSMSRFPASETPAVRDRASKIQKSADLILASLKPS